MNILFITPSEVQPLNGGIERTTLALSRQLHGEYGYMCRFMNLVEGCSKEQLEAEIQAQHIDIIIAQGADKRIANLLSLLRTIIDEKNWKIILLFAFHSNPGVELATMDYGALLYSIFHNINTKAAIRQLGWQVLKPFIEGRMIKHLKKKYRLPYDYADKVVLLSDRFIPEYQFFSGGEQSHFRAIPNMLPLNESDCTPAAKEKVILLVSRMEERQKRIKLALQIWRRIPRNGWKLKIVGAGEDLNYFLFWAKKWDLKDVSFEGRQNPISYYRKASVFMMTSAFEGLPMTILEAQQNGCVPVVFDTFASLPDVVTDGRNGFIVPERNIDEYVARLTQLMNDESLRKEMAENAIKDCQRFAPEKVAEQWHKLFTELLNNN
jgi:glycosyltransferase involved in cell wall biosynthesis